MGEEGRILMKNMNPEMKRKLLALVTALAVMAAFIGANFFYAKTITLEVLDPEVFFDKVPADTGYETVTFYLDEDVNETVYDYIYALRDECGMRITEKEENAEDEYSYTLRYDSSWFDLFDEWFAEVHLPEIIIDVEGNEVFIVYEDSCVFVDEVDT